MVHTDLMELLRLELSPRGRDQTGRGQGLVGRECEPRHSQGKQMARHEELQVWLAQGIQG